VILAAAVETKQIRLTSAVTVLSAADPVCVFQEFATINLLSHGRAEIVAWGRRSHPMSENFGRALAPGRSSSYIADCVNMNSKFEKGKPLAELHLGEEGFQRAMDAAPELTHLVVEHGFADMYTNDALDQRARKIATLASLITSASLPQLEWHIRGALVNNLLTADEIKEIIIQMTIYIGYPAAYNAMGVAKRVFADFPVSGATS